MTELHLVRTANVLDVPETKLAIWQPFPFLLQWPLDVLQQMTMTRLLLGYYLKKKKWF